MTATPPVVLTIAGFDPSSGAGVTADLKTIAAHECYGIACITALTVQSTQGVRRVDASDPKIVFDTLAELASDFTIDGVHVGMLGNEQVVRAVHKFLSEAQLPHLVVDPILKSTSGATLVDSGGMRLLLEKVVPLAELITPNCDEAAALTGLPVTNLEQMKEAAGRLHSLGAKNIVVTGGHLEKATDLLSFTTLRGVETEVFKADRQRSKSTHGTGCAFSTALACHLAHGRGLPEAVLLSKAYISAAISNAYPIGKGAGPLNHLYRMGQQRRVSTVIAHAETVHS